MRLRQNFFPPSAINIGCILLVFTFILITFVFEMIIVIPEFHELGGFFYIFTLALGLFLIFNIMANMIACIIVDTTIQSVFVTSSRDEVKRKLWHYCSACEKLAPPRSWHCKKCRTCILKRDHHCGFTGNCVGHKNHRYFLLFIIYVFIGTAYATIYNSIYFWVLHADTFVNLTTFFKIIYPMFIFVDTSWNSFYFLVHELNIAALVYTLLVMILQVSTLLYGGVKFERNKARQYDLGWKRNLKMVLGHRLHLVWLSPFLKSDLPHNGLHWETNTQEPFESR